MIKMDMIWIAVALLIYPNTSSKRLVTRSQTEKKVVDLFGENITPIMIEKHLVSWEDRQADKSHPRRGGSRNRYLYRTEDGISPSGRGDFRLYKQTDNAFDGEDKTGRIYPNKNEIPAGFHYLIEWFIKHYHSGE